MFSIVLMIIEIHTGQGDHKGNRDADTTGSVDEKIPGKAIMISFIKQQSDFPSIYVNTHSNNENKQSTDKNQYKQHKTYIESYDRTTKKG